MYTNIYRRLQLQLHTDVYINDALCIYKVGWVCICIFVHLCICVFAYLSICVFVYLQEQGATCISMRRRGQMHCVFIRWAGFVFTARGHWHADLGGTYGTLSRFGASKSLCHTNNTGYKGVQAARGGPSGVLGAHQGIRWQVWGCQAGAWLAQAPYGGMLETLF